MRSTCVLLACLAAACSDDASPPPAPAAAPAVAAPGRPPAPELERAEVSALAQRLVEGTASAADAATAAAQASATVAAMLEHGAKLSLAEQARVPNALAQLGTPALPGLASALSHEDTVQRRIAALTLLQLGDSLHANGTAEPVVAALDAARKGDADPSVRAAAEFAWRKATGDTTAIDESRRRHEAAQRGELRGEARK